jgi:predicted nucleotidyltransferase
MGTSMKVKKKKNGSRPDPAILAVIVECVARVAEPERIILFGSGARGTMGPDSDIDLLVIKSGKFNYWRLMNRIRHELPGTAAVDIVLARSEDVERYRDTHCLVYSPALREGKIVYDSQAVAARRSPRMVEASAQQPRSGTRG